MLVLWALMLGSLAGDPAFTEGQQLYDQLEYEQAIFRFQEVAVRPELSPEDRATALTWLGLTYAGVGNMNAARRSFVDAARAWPAVSLPVEVAPSLVRVFEDARRSATAQGSPTSAPRPVPMPPATSTAASSRDEGELPVWPAVGIAAGAAVVVAGVGLAVVSAATYAGAQDQQLYQPEAKAQLDLANLELGAGYVAIPIGLAVTAASAWLLLEGGAP